MSNHTDRNGKPIDLNAVLEAHALWQRTGGAEGQRAYLAGAYLAGADLAGADLADADLAGADLAGADLAGADLARADLAGAYLAGADLAGASGFVLLTETDHGFRVVAMMRGDEWRIYAGCRDFTVDHARAHWGATDYQMPLSGRRVVACLDWLESEIAAGFTLEAK